MKLSFLKYKTSVLLKKQKPSSRNSIPYKKALTTGIIFTVEDKQKHFAIKDFIKKLEGDGKHVQVLEYLPEKTENYEFKFDFFSDKDVTFWGNIRSENALQFADAPFDFLFYLDLNPNPMVMNILARSHAKCRVGKFWDNSDHYLDFMIDSVSNTQALLETLYKYVSQLK
jgi:hypothetical protein